MAKTKNPQLELERRNEIMLTTLKIMIQSSHQAMTLEAVAKETKMSKGLVSYYFKNKDTLILETMRFFLSMHRQRLLSIASDEAPIKKRIQNLIEAALPSTEEVRQMIRFHSELVSFAKNNPQGEKALIQFYGDFRDVCGELIRIGIAEGHVKNKDAKWLAVFVHALFDGLGIQISFDPDLDLPTLRKKAFEFLSAIFGMK